MNDSYIGFPDDGAISDDGWQRYCSEAQAEIRNDLESILDRMETGTTTKADAMLIAGYIGLGQRYETSRECPQHFQEDERE